MGKERFRGSAEITAEGIKKHFKNYEPWQAIFELVWNGLDAKATEVSIRVDQNDLDGVELVTVLDNGNGIDFHNSSDNFGKFNDSSKSQNAEQHGSHGRGRLAFHRLSRRATWYTRYQGEDARIDINSSSIKYFDVTPLASDRQHSLLRPLKSGTCVELSNFLANLPDNDDLLSKLSIEFGWYLALNSEIKIYLNGRAVPIPPHELTEQEFEIEGYDFLVRAIRWEKAPSSEKSCNYLLDSNNNILHRELSSFNKKPNFFVSVYISSPWADRFEAREQDLITSHEFTLSSSVWRTLINRVKTFTRSIYEDFLRKFVDQELERFEEEGVFPDYQNERKEYAEWRRNHTKELVRSIYIADPSVFTNLKKKQRKIIVRLLDKLAVSNENDSLFDVLESVMDLDGDAMQAFASQLKRTRLEHIISTIELLQKREMAVHRLKEVMDNHYADVLETPDLQKIIENNTWLFGSEYEILGAEEDNFTKIAKELRDKVPGIDDISANDVEHEKDLDGAQKQVDLFLARKKLSIDSSGKQFFKCVIIEIKRPSVALNYKHLRQLDDYARILGQYPEFSSDKIKFDLILVGRTISKNDSEIRSRMEGLVDKGEPGLVSIDSKMKRYVKNWYTIFHEFEISNNYLLEALKTQRENLSKASSEELVASLQRAS